MQDLKDKMNTYEVTPPYGNWEKIFNALEDKSGGKLQPVKSSSKTFYFTLAAAAVAIVIFSIVFYFNNPSKRTNETVASLNAEITKDSNNANSLSDDEKITVPKSNWADEEAADNNTQYADNTISDAGSKKYITITGPQGECVQISSKAATLIVEPGDQDPSKPIWNAKVKKWKDIMLANTLAPTTANFLDIVELTHALRVSNP